MKFSIGTTNASPAELRVGNVYPIKGGYGRREGHLMVLIAIAEPPNQYQAPSCLMLVIDSTGKPKGVTSYSIHALEERAAIAFVDGIEDLTFEIRSL